ncbi:MAG: M48 family metallopeptidase [Ignavibacteria bacterium]|nr:M48 family metallopeptidase [Ignavibacteria bacterium]
MTSKTDNVISIQFGSRKIEYTVEFKSRKTLGIIVTPKQLVKVYAPSKSSLEKIHAVVKKKISWIIKSLDYYELMLPKFPQHKFISGESYYYLGRHCRLKVVKSNLEDVRLKGSIINVFTIYKSNPRVINILIDSWYKEKAKKKFAQRLEINFEKFNKLIFFKPKLSVKVMRTRWGSCNTNDSLILNQLLIKTPTRCIDYVIIHELCHLIYRNHDHRFYNLLNSMLPDWRDRKKELEKNVYKI